MKAEIIKANFNYDIIDKTISRVISRATMKLINFALTSFPSLNYKRTPGNFLLCARIRYKLEN